MSEVVNVVVALAVIVVVISWATSSKESPEDRSARAALGFRPKNVTPEMLETISGMFPDMPRDNIRYDLLRTGSVEMTTNKIIERGFLDAPPAGYYRIYPRESPAARATGVSTGAFGARASSSKSAAKHPSLISRFHLEERVVDDTTPADIAPEDAGGKAAWEATPERREASLKERKAQMILAARKRMLEGQKAASASN
ncbi:hypothetical protein M0805_007972 [Coniferiporia weirii]|nr:hypothetical protein M0805_007972 [Coniferiporia weirii]